MEKYEKQDMIEIDIRRLLATLWSRAWLLLLAGALTAALTFGYAWFFISPTYSAGVQLYVNNNYVDSPGFSSSQIAAAQDLAATYMVIMESRNVLDDVRERTKLGYTYSQLKGMVSASSVNETEVFEIRVVCGNYQHAAMIANTVAEVLPDKIAAVVEGSSVRVVDYAVENPNPVGPNYRSYLMMGAFIGCLLCAVVVVIADLLDTTINSEEYLSQVYGNLPLLAVIPGAENPRTGSYKGYYEAAKRKVPAINTGGTKR